ncbi:MAG TPA: hypothetical protein PLB25_08380 [Rhodoferax sp.]|nr:hypothetical protein [Rhodoferax sp.]
MIFALGAAAQVVGIAPTVTDLRRIGIRPDLCCVVPAIEAGVAG